MAEEVTIARPYAEAVNRLAQQGNAYDQWSQMLGFAAQVADDPQMRALIDNPNVSEQQREQTFLAVCGDQLNEEGKNLIHVLVENGRLELLPQIHAIFEQLKAAQEGTVDAQIYTAYPLTDAQLAELVGHLRDRLHRAVDATVSVDPELLGGVKIVVGDQVIDATVRGQLEKMSYSLKS